MFILLDIYIKIGHDLRCLKKKREISMYVACLKEYKIIDKIVYTHILIC